MTKEKNDNEVARKAYELYEQSGKVEGRDLENWLEAEKLVWESKKKGTGKTTTKKKPTSTRKSKDQTKG